ncbi:copper amine oxidase N-terminal domain-containing protein [Paenibacillus camerounensis]|uniref:copper amine oxidase N-terminal domain-containing protein n=1 Tax=Paenibacillus camerounensis TaxID=1243663 RepID=UPI0005AA0DD7|nr:copper amine oxidase N-terminal domain-containing protein [Paenibacillus camerounensis]
MKKQLTVLFIFTMISLLGASAASATKLVGEPNLAVLVDGRKVKFGNAKPYMENGRVMVPIRNVAEKLGAKVTWNATTRTAGFTLADRSVDIQVGADKVYVNGEAKAIDAKAIEKNGSVYVPLRFVSLGLGVPLEWDQVGNWAWIGEKKIPTMEEAGIKAVPIGPYEKIFKGEPILLWDSNDEVYSTISIFTIDQLPIRNGNRIYYDIWPVAYGNQVFLRARTSKELMSIYYLSSLFKSKFRGPMNYFLEHNQDGTKMLAYRVAFIDDEFMIKLNQIEYIGLSLYDKSASIIKNPFK